MVQRSCHRKHLRRSQACSVYHVVVAGVGRDARVRNRLVAEPLRRADPEPLLRLAWPPPGPHREALDAGIAVSHVQRKWGSNAGLDEVDHCLGHLVPLGVEQLLPILLPCGQRVCWRHIQGHRVLVVQGRGLSTVKGHQGFEDGDTALLRSHLTRREAMAVPHSADIIHGGQGVVARSDEIRVQGVDAQGRILDGARRCRERLTDDLAAEDGPRRGQGLPEAHRAEEIHVQLLQLQCSFHTGAFWVELILRRFPHPATPP
mmetsp:Transcript_143750/g.460102  ORF Transcript_143750/g.460102 Transcript_143750/m.460102 type:complete len:260 (-) Transcript_143750:117-896(-)